MGYNYCKNCLKNITNAMAKREDIYINKEIQYWIGVLTDLFCLDHTPIVILKRPTKKDRRGYHGICHSGTTPIVIKIYTDYDGKFKLSTLVHEFLHACGYNHTWEINGWANFRSSNDNFSRLIVKDLTGKYELIL